MFRCHEEAPALRSAGDGRLAACHLVAVASEAAAAATRPHRPTGHRHGPRRSLPSHTRHRRGFRRLAARSRHAGADAQHPAAGGARHLVPPGAQRLPLGDPRRDQRDRHRRTARRARHRRQRLLSRRRHPRAHLRHQRHRHAAPGGSPSWRPADRGRHLRRRAGAGGQAARRRPYRLGRLGPFHQSTRPRQRALDLHDARQRGDADAGGGRRGDRQARPAAGAPVAAPRRTRLWRQVDGRRC